MSRHEKQDDTGSSPAGGSDGDGKELVRSAIDDSMDLPEVTRGNTQECYITMTGAPGIVEKLETLLAIGKERQDDEVYQLARTIKWEFGRLCTIATAQIKSKKKSEALNVIAQDWGWQHKNIGYDIIYLLRTRCEMPVKDLAAILGVSEPAIVQGVQRYTEKIGEQNKLYEDSEKHERADLLMERIYRYIMDPLFPAMDRDKLNAAKAYVELYNKQLERDTSLTWRQVSLVSDWFFSELLPTLQQRLQAESASVNIRQICLDLFEKLSGEMKDLSTQIKVPPQPIAKDANEPPKLTKSGRPRKKAGRKPKGGEKHI